MIMPQIRSEIISFGDFFRYYTLRKIEDKLFLHIAKEDEPNEEKEVTQREAIDLLARVDFCPSKVELLHLADAGLLDSLIARIRSDMQE